MERPSRLQQQVGRRAVDGRREDELRGARPAKRAAWRAAAGSPAGWSEGERAVATEMPIAMSYNRVGHAVMMASPIDLEDFALGFSLAEEIVADAREIEELEVVPLPAATGGVRGVELRMWIGEDRMDALERRRRNVSGPTGCGMCGLESLEAALRPVRAVPEGRRFGPDAVQAAVAALRPAQLLNAETRAVHGAGFWTEAEGLVALREDVGRHNALDKLHGALVRREIRPADGILVMTSRISVELVQKAALMGAAVLAAVSAPTSLALQMAEEAGLTLIAVAREDGFELCTHGWRIR